MILVIAEQREGTLNRASWEPVAAAQTLGDPVTIAIAGTDLAPIAAELAKADVAEVIALEDPRLRAYTADGFTAAFARLVGELQPALVFASHTYQARDFIPKLAARLDRALITDCLGFAERDGTRLWSRPMFQAKLTAEVAAEGPAPHLVTFQAGAFRADAVRVGAQAAPVRTVPAGLTDADVRQVPEPPFKEAKQAVDLTQAERIVAVGRGIKDAERIELARQLAAALGAELAASRPICDAGWLPMDRQIGSSGQTVAPKLYLALGISGAIQHVVGMKGSRTIVAINKDPEAPIFEIADYGIVGDLFEIVPALIEALNA